jgi:hypothetical protein
MSRRALAALALVGLLVTSGCLGGLGGGGPMDADRLDRQPGEPYEWNASSDVHITITASADYRAVYDTDAERFGGRLNLSQTDALGTKRPLTVSSLRYRYPNGTVINGTELEAHGGDLYTESNELRVVPPAEGGQIAFSGESTPKRFSLPVFLDGSTTVVLPPDRRTDVPLFGQVVPEPTEKRSMGNQVVLYWEDLTAPSMLVRYYIQRDILIFGGLAGGLVVVGAVGLLRYRRELKRLREQREEMGLDVETGEDDDGPPPGMR